MVSRCHYDSPLGGILLAADEIGLTGLWFDGEKYFADHLPSEHTERETPILVEKSLTFCRRCTPSAPRFGSLYGKFFYRFPTERPQPTARSHGSLPKNGNFPGCPRRPSAVR